MDPQPKPPGPERDMKPPERRDGQAVCPTSHWLVAVCGLAVVTLVMFGPVLFGPQNIVLSNKDHSDLLDQYSHWRQFGFGQLRNGNLPLWNPHIFSGAPFFGLQSGLLYPLNAFFLILPLARAINLTIALHVFLAGVFTWLWAARRGLQPLACFLSAVLFMFCGPHVLHIYAGHLPHLCAMAWPPLILLAIDGVFEKPGLGWILVGIFAVAMQVLGGHPQYVFYTAIAAAVYSLLCCFSQSGRLTPALSSSEGARANHRQLSGESRLMGREGIRSSNLRRRLRFLLCLVAVVVGGAGLAAVQLLSGIHDLRETWRGDGVSQTWAATFSFPPENLLTLLAPGFFGSTGKVAYWGRWDLWEMTLFISVTGLVLALIGAVWGERRIRRFSLWMVLILLLLALGGYSPLFPLLYKWVPGFGSLRGNSKFILLAALFLVMLAGIGLDALLRGRRIPRSVSVGIASAGVLLIPLALWLRSASFVLPADSWWHRAVFASLRSRIQAASVNADVDPRYLLQTGLQASNSLLLATATLIVLALLLFLAGHYRKVVWMIFGLALLEIMVFARPCLDTFDLSRATDAELQAFLKDHPGDYRIFNPSQPNAAMSLPAQDIWGYDPGIPLRYSQVLAFAHCTDPATWTRLRLANAGPLFAMCRLRFVFNRRNGQFQYLEGRDYLPHLLLLQRYRVLTNSQEILPAVTDPAFNPYEEVILESVPDPPPGAIDQSGTARIVDSSTDSLTIDAVVKSPSILLITDNYVKGWCARVLPGSVQSAYRVMPANYCLRAIPLAAGHHFLRLEYRPGAFEWGKWVSLASLGLFLITAFATAIREFRELTRSSN